MKANARILLIVLSIILVLTITSCGPKKYWCPNCEGDGKSKCRNLIVEESLVAAGISNKNLNNHDCSKCNYGIQICDQCNGTGEIIDD